MALGLLGSAARSRSHCRHKANPGHAAYLSGDGYPESAPAYPEDCQEYAQDRRGLDRTEVYQIREYVPGDSLSQIHWKLTSKRETLLVREPACPVEQSLLFLVDRTWGTLEPSQADTLMEAAASISPGAV